MKKGMANILLIGLVVLLFFVFYSDKDESEFSIGDNYIYEGNNETYEFIVDEVGSTKFHVLNLSYKYKEGNIWKSYVSTIPFEYSPMELEYLDIDENIRDMILDSEVVLLTRDPMLDKLMGQRNGVAFMTLTRILDDAASPYIFSIPTGIGVTSAVEGVDSTVVDCSNSNANSRVIEFRLANPWLKNDLLRNILNMFMRDKIYVEDECIVVEFRKPENSVKLATRLTYEILEIM